MFSLNVPWCSYWRFGKKCYHEYSYTNLILIFENTFLIDFFLKLDIIKSVNFFYPDHVYGLELSKLLKTCRAIKEGLQFAIIVANFVLLSQYLGIFFLLPLFIIVWRLQQGPPKDFQPIKNRSFNKELGVRTSTGTILFFDWFVSILNFSPFRMGYS